MFTAHLLRGAVRAPVMRNVVQRRLASTDNAFVKEREAVKAHASGSSGMYKEREQ